MSIEWIDVTVRVPDNRRSVLAWGFVTSGGIWRSDKRFLGVTHFNPSKSGGLFGCERNSNIMYGSHVTHWAEIEGPPQ